MKFRLAYPYQ